MKNILTAAIGGVLLLSAAGASGQAIERVYDRTGSVWTISYIETKPGQFNAYLKDIGAQWKARRALGQKRGEELSYKILQVADARENEPNLILMVEYKNMAARDIGLAQEEADTKAVMGSLDVAQQKVMNREALRTQRGSLMARELTFTK